MPGASDSEMKLLPFTASDPLIWASFASSPWPTMNTRSASPSAAIWAGLNTARCSDMLPLRRSSGVPVPPITAATMDWTGTTEATTRGPASAGAAISRVAASRAGRRRMGTSTCNLII